MPTAIENAIQLLDCTEVIKIYTTNEMENIDQIAKLISELKRRGYLLEGISLKPDVAKKLPVLWKLSIILSFSQNKLCNQSDASCSFSGTVSKAIRLTYIKASTGLPFSSVEIVGKF